MSPDSGAELQPKERQYGEVLQDKTKIFHGVGFDTLRFASILEHGLLSERAAQARGHQITRNYGGYNLDDTVSMTASPSAHGTYDHGAFRSYVKEGIGLVVNSRGLDTFAAPPMQESGKFGMMEPMSFRSSRASLRASGYPDEVYAAHEVPPQNIVGVMVPEEKLETPVADLPLGLSKMGYDYIDERCTKMVADIEQRLGYKADTSELEELMRRKWEMETSQIGYAEKDKARKDIFAAMDKFLGSYIGQAYAHDMGKLDVTLDDVLQKYVPEGMQVYNSDGLPIELQRGALKESG